MSTPDGDNSPNFEKRLIFVGGETDGANTAEGNSASTPDNTARALFSKVVLKTESQAGYDSLATGLRAACQPKGTLEQILVEKLAAILWRYRRLIAAESGEIGENLSALGRTDVRLKERDRLASEAFKRRDSGQGIIGMIYDPGFLSDCLRDLQNLRDRLKAGGSSNTVEDHAVLSKLYGQQLNSSGGIDDKIYERDSLYAEYKQFFGAMTKKERSQENVSNTQERHGLLVQATEKEIRRLTEIQNALNESAPEQAELEQLRRNLPDANRMERLLRYEASLERAFDRTLAQLGRLQGMRLGQPVTTTLKLGIPA